MAISRSQMSQQISKPSRKKVKKVIKGLKKASKLHAKQANTLSGVIKQRGKKTKKS